MGCQKRAENAPEAAIPDPGPAEAERLYFLVGWTGAEPDGDEIELAKLLAKGVKTKEIATSPAAQRIKPGGVTTRAVGHWKDGNRRPVVSFMRDRMLEDGFRQQAAEVLDASNEALSVARGLLRSKDRYVRLRAAEMIFGRADRAELALTGKQGGNGKSGAQANVQVNVGGGLDASRDLAKRLRSVDLSRDADTATVSDSGVSEVQDGGESGIDGNDSRDGEVVG